MVRNRELEGRLSNIITHQSNTRKDLISGIYQPTAEGDDVAAMEKKLSKWCFLLKMLSVNSVKLGSLKIHWTSISLAHWKKPLPKVILVTWKLKHLKRCKLHAMTRFK